MLKYAYLGLLVFLVSCKFGSAPLSETTGYVTEGNSALWDGKEIPVCFEVVTPEIFRLGWVDPNPSYPPYDADDDQLADDSKWESDSERPVENSDKLDTQPDADQPHDPTGEITATIHGPANAQAVTNAPIHGSPGNGPKLPTINEIKEFRNQVRAVIVREYNQRTRLNFTGFGQCAADSKGIRIAITSGEARVEAFGKFIDGIKYGVKLPFNPRDRFGDVCETVERRLLCLEGYALHEFGHAIGLRHEANRPDSSCPRDQFGGAGEKGAIMVDKYDKRSIMNYCWNEAQMIAEIKPRLSRGDIATIEKYYSGKVEFPKVDKADACQKQGHTWNSINHCCNPSKFAGLKTEDQPFEFCQSAQLSCAMDKGAWDEAKNCCEKPAKQSETRLYSTCEEVAKWSQPMENHNNNSKPGNDLNENNSHESQPDDESQWLENQNDSHDTMESMPAGVPF